MTSKDPAIQYLDWQAANLGAIVRMVPNPRVPGLVHLFSTGFDVRMASGDNSQYMRPMFELVEDSGRRCADGSYMTGSDSSRIPAGSCERCINLAYSCFHCTEHDDRGWSLPKRLIEGK